MFGASTKLKEIKIPDSVKTLEGLVFYGCSGLSSVTMNSVESIGREAFEECTALQQITLPSTLTTIGAMAFYNSGLKSVEIPGSVHDTATTDGEGNESTVYGLGYAAFNSCIYLESVKIANGVETIPSGAFGYCIALKEIYIPLSVKEVQGAYYSSDGSYLFGHAFYGDTALINVYYEGTEEEWKGIDIDSTKISGQDNSALINAAKHYENK